MRILCKLFICVLFIPTVACSVVGKRLYYEPQVHGKWSYLERAAYPIAEYRCSDAVLHIYSSQVGEKMYTIGPPFIPIVPTFAIFDIAPGEKGFDILIVTEGTMTNPNLQQNSLRLTFDESAAPLEAQKVHHTHCDQSSKDNRWRCVYYYLFQKSLATHESFTAEINQRFNDCTIPSITYKKKDYSYFYPFIYPLPEVGGHE